ncbi:MAG: trypsin-like peptidase domain-containing protein [Planctomycetota bacterium]|jgi:S1-C subfamily serine protease
MARILLALLALCVIFSSPAYATIGEDIFKQAPVYTVQIRTVVEMPFSEDKRTSALGAGFVVDAERGWIMTNAHVAARSPSRVRIAFRGGDYGQASKVYVDPYLDLAILQLSDEQRRDLKEAKLDCDEFPPMGHPVGAFGHPWSLYYTGTRGIISGVTAQMGGEMLQTDAPINGGNSGGPLISLESGKIVGINTSSIDDDEDQNTNFATPMKYACRVLELLRAGEDPSPPRLSTIFITDLDDRGELIVGKTYTGPETIALQAGDMITAVVGAPGEIQNEGQLVHALRGRLDRFALRVIRKGQEITLTGKLYPVGHVAARRGVYVSGALFARAGFRDKKELNLTQPLMAHHVDRGSLAESLDIGKWDILVSIDGQPVGGLTNLHERISAARQDERPVTLVLKRWSKKNDQVYDYIERTMVIEELEFVGSAPNKSVARLPKP